MSTTNSQPEYQCISHISPGVSRTSTARALECDLFPAFHSTHIHRPAIDNHSTVYYSIDNRLSDNASFELIVSLRIWNANIPVFGDSEQIITMEETEGTGMISRNGVGSIDDVDVRNSVISILEGGPRAFKMREEKYGI